MHSAKTVWPESASPSCGKYPALMPLAGRDRAVVEGFEPGEDLHQGGFAGAVRAHQADAVFGRDQPVRSFKEQLVAVALSRRGQLNHRADSIVS